MRGITVLLLFTAVLTLAAPVAGAAEDPARPAPGNTSTYKVRVAVTYPEGTPEVTRLTDALTGEPSPDDANAANEEALRREREHEERLERERQEREREAAERERERLRQEEEAARVYIPAATPDVTSTVLTIDEFPTEAWTASGSGYPSGADSRVLATLDGKVITESDVSQEMWLRRGRETFDWLVGREILRRELERLDLRVSDAEVKESLDKHLVVLRKAYPKLRKRDDLTRAASGMTLDEYRERTVWAELALRKIMRATLDTRDEDLRRFFATVRADYIRPERVRIAQIFIPPQISPDADGIADAEAWRRAEEQIQEAHALLRRQDFADVARVFGTGGAASRWVGRGDLLRELEGPVFSIEAGSITTPIKSAVGWHMLMVEEKEERKEPNLDEVREDVLARYEEERFVRLAGEFMARLKEKALGDGSLVLSINN